MASIREVAKLAHVAPSTVSRALNGSGYVSEKSKNKIKKAVEELDYIPNQWIRNLYKKRTGIIGVMTPDIIHPYFSTLWNYLEAELDQYGYNVVICNTRGNQDKEREYLDTLERNLFDGLIVGSAFLSDEYYMNIEKPIISLDRIIPGIPLVTSDHHQGGILAGELFLEKGCKKVMELWLWTCVQPPSSRQKKTKKYWLMMELMSRTSITIRLIQLYRMRRRLQRKV